MDDEVKQPDPKLNYISPQEYLATERAATEKHEYYKGEVSAMSGASTAHNKIAYNINRLAASYLHGKDCKLYGNDFRVHIPEHLLYTYPDFSIVCGKMETDDIYTDNVANPTVLIEILSKSTMDYDRGTKFNFYRSIKSLQEYILIDSTSVCIETFLRQEDKSWLFNEYKQLSQSFFIHSISLTLHLKDIYDDVSVAE